MSRRMPVAALLLALGSAGLHASWNVLVARADDAEAAAAAVLLASVVLFAPVAAATWRFEAAAVPYAAGSAAFELGYVALLGAAYRRAELSVVYPVARGAAPMLVLVASVVALAARPSALEVAGVVAVAGGILLVRGPRGGRGVALGLAIACCIAGYTLLDSRGVRHANAIAYLDVVLAAPAAAYGGWLLARRPVEIRPALGAAAVVGGAASFGAYALVLVALRLAPAASVAAVRETSVVVAVALAALVLREPVGRARVAGAAAVVVGVALLSL
jgi:drug/metabolite transporter (DMT)-like permease